MATVRAEEKRKRVVVLDIHKGGLLSTHLDWMASDHDL
jgi:hypothetical protein